MTGAGAGADVPVESLQLGERLGRGGQGDVYRVRNRPGEVLKRYHSPKVDAGALAALVRFPVLLDAGEQEALRRQASWPLARATERGRVVGFLMREVPAAFLGRTAAGSQLRELQYLLYEPKPMWGDIRPLGVAERIDLAHAYVRLIRILHEHDIVIGDISMANLLWSPGYPPQAYLIDCDSPTPVGGAPVLPIPETPDWNDPLRPPVLGLDSDRYKIALLVGRMLSRSADVRPGERLSLPVEIPERIARAVTECFAAAAGPLGTRPDATRWLQAIRGRSTRELGAPPAVRTRPPLPQAAADGRPPRGSVPLQPRRRGPG